MCENQVKDERQFFEEIFLEIERGEMWEIDNWLSETLLYQMLWNLKTSKVKNFFVLCLGEGCFFLVKLPAKEKF